MVFGIKNRRTTWTSIWGDQYKGQATAGSGDTAFECSMRGYKRMANEIIKLSLVAFTANTAIIEQFLDMLSLKYLAVSVDMTYTFMLGFGGWAGYLVAALYYFGLEFGYADMMCEFSGYGNLVIHYLGLAVSFGGGL